MRRQKGCRQKARGPCALWRSAAHASAPARGPHVHHAQRRVLGGLGTRRTRAPRRKCAAAAGRRLAQRVRLRCRTSAPLAHTYVFSALGRARPRGYHDCGGETKGQLVAKAQHAPRLQAGLPTHRCRSSPRPARAAAPPSSRRCCKSPQAALRSHPPAPSHASEWRCTEAAGGRERVASRALYAPSLTAAIRW